MIIVHHLNNSRSQRILWMLEEMALDYKIVHYQRDDETMLAPPELAKIHALGKSPIIEDGDNIVAETGAIVDYLIETYDKSKLVPAMGTKEWIQYRYWLHFAEGSAMSPLLVKLIFDRMEVSPVPFFIRPIIKGISKKVKAAFVEPRMKTHLEFFETELTNSKWFAGNQFSAADIMMSFPLEVSVKRAGLDEKYPHLVSFIEQIQARPCYQKALERGGKYDY